jgi:hypothetical protein
MLETLENGKKKNTTNFHYDSRICFVNFFIKIVSFSERDNVINKCSIPFCLKKSKDIKNIFLEVETISRKDNFIFMKTTK